VKWMIRVDMEGLTGIVSMEQVIPGGSEYHVGLQMLGHDLQAVLDGLLQGEEDEVWLYDIHFFGRNVDLSRLESRVKAICGKPDYNKSNGAFVDASFDGVILLGLHAKSETPGALLHHNYEHDIRSMKVNGLSVGEIGLEALMAGESGVPLVLVTADSEGCKEAEALLPGTLTVCVKQSLGNASALCYPPAITGPKLRAAAKSCASVAAQLKPYVIEGPIELEMAFYDGPLLQRLRGNEFTDQTASDTFIFTGSNVVDAWEKYLKAKV